MSPSEIREVIDVCPNSIANLKKFRGFDTFRFLKSRRAHGRQQSPSSLPDLGKRDNSHIPERELSSFEAYTGRNQNCLLCDYLKLELSKNERLSARMMVRGGRTVLGSVAF